MDTCRPGPRPLLRLPSCPGRPSPLSSFVFLPLPRLACSFRLQSSDSESSAPESSAPNVRPECSGPASVCRILPASRPAASVVLPAHHIPWCRSLPGLPVSLCLPRLLCGLHFSQNFRACGPGTAGSAIHEILRSRQIAVPVRSLRFCGKLGKPCRNGQGGRRARSTRRIREVRPDVPGPIVLAPNVQASGAASLSGSGVRFLFSLRVFARFFPLFS